MGPRRILDGITVLEFTAYQSGTVGGALLAQLGARVIKIEQPGIGDPSRGTTHVSGARSSLPGGRTVVFETSNTDKLSITLDLKQAAGRELAVRLLTRADAFITNYRERVLESVGLDYESARKVNPELVYVRASGAGPGDSRDARSFDWIGQARSGLMYSCGHRAIDEPSVIVGGPIDQLGGTYAAMSVLAGLLGRERLGIAQRVDVSLLGSAIYFQNLRFNQHTLAGQAVRTHGRAESRQPLANWYRCADSRWLLMCEIQPDRFWHDFCKVLGQPELADDERFTDSAQRRANYRQLIEILDAAFATGDRDSWLQRFADDLPDFAICPVLDVDEVVDDEVVRASGYVTEVDHQTFGPTLLAGCPMAFSETPARIERGAPELGEHTERVLIDELGLSWEEIGELHSTGVL